MTLLKALLLAAVPLAARAQLVIDLEKAMAPDAPGQDAEPPLTYGAHDTDIRSNGKLCDPTVQQHSGYVKFAGSGNASKSYFFWLFESRSAPSEDPLVIWLNGGPGCSSMMGLLMENGPCTVQKNGEVVRNEYSWTNKANVLWVDQPAGAGFSSGAWDHGEEGVGEDFYAFLQGLFEHLPQYRAKGLYITGESYAGHYIPAIAHHIYTMNKAASADSTINLKGIAIGNGMTNTEEQYKWYPQMALDGGKAAGGSLKEGVITNRVAIELMTAAYWPCKQMIKMCNRGWKAACLDAFIRCNYAEMVPYQLTRMNPYDMRLRCEHLPLCYDFSQIEAFLNQPEVQGELGAKGGWRGCSMFVNKLFMADFMRSFHQLIPPLMAAGIDVLIYAGDVDFICNWIGNKMWSLALEWPGKRAFNLAPDLKQHLNGEAIGRLRSHENFHFMQVYNAGHMVPMDQPEAALDMLNRFIAGEMRTAGSSLEAGSETEHGEPGEAQAVADYDAISAKVSVDALVDGVLVAELQAALDAENLDAENVTAPEDGQGGRTWGYRGETCCMCSLQLPHLGTLLYAAGDYDHSFGSHSARWQCDHVCRDQCRRKGRGRYLGCYDENHIRSVSRQYSHRRGWNIWEKDGEIC